MLPSGPSLGYLHESPSQTAGPYVHIGLIPHQAGFEMFEKPFGNVLVGPDTPGERIRIEGRVLDGQGAPSRDILVEIWQADAQGRAARSAQQVLDLTNDRYSKGAVNYFDVVDAERSLLAIQLGATQTLDARYAATVALVRTLGGGWGEAPTAARAR